MLSEEDQQILASGAGSGFSYKKHALSSGARGGFVSMEELSAQELFCALKRRWNLQVESFTPLFELMGRSFCAKSSTRRLYSLFSRGKRGAGFWTCIPAASPHSPSPRIVPLHRPEHMQ